MDLQVWGGGGASVGMAGTLAQRPAAGTLPNGTSYFVTDDDGGTPFMVIGGAWVQTAPGVAEFGGQELFNAEFTNNPAAQGVGGFADIAGWSSPPFTPPRPVTWLHLFVPKAYNDTAGGAGTFAITDAANNVLGGTPQETSSAAAQRWHVNAWGRATPAMGVALAAGAFKVRWAAVFGGLLNTDIGVNNKAFLRAFSG